MATDYVITAKPAQGFWRCGVHHAPTPARHKAGRFTAKELERLKAEPMLVVEEVEAVNKTEEADEEKSGGKGKKK